MDEAQQVALIDEGAIDYEALIMAGLVPSEDDQSKECLDNLTYLLGKIDLLKLKKSNHALVQCMMVYRDETGNKGILTEDVLIDIMMQEGVPPETQVKYQELYYTYRKMEVSQAKFRYAIGRFVQCVEEKDYLQSLDESYAILSRGLTVGKRQLRGYKDSREHLSRRLYDVTRRQGTLSIKEGNIREEASIVLDDMRNRRAAPEQFRGMMTGIRELDDATNGIQPGELLFLGGFTEVGKSFSCLNMAHNACTKLGLNIAIGTGEVMYEQYRLRAAVLHSRSDRWGLPQGIESKSYEKGLLTAEEMAGFEKAMKDFKDNPNYGAFFLFQIPKGVDISWVHNKLVAYNSVAPIHAFFLDSLALLTPVGRGDQKRSAMNDMIKEAKQMAISFDNQRGIPVVSPWHSNRKSWEKAVKDGYYTLGSWSEADELERSADVMMWLLKLENAGDTHEIQAGICKNRSGAGNLRFVMYEDFASAYIGSALSGKTAMGHSAASVGGIGMDERVRDLF